MSSLQAIQLLTTAARIAQEEQTSFSKEGIMKKLQELKYLSAQKKVPRLSLRKEIIHLENQLQGALELEGKLRREKEKESLAVTSLKQQIETLKNKLKVAESTELEKKIEHLSFVLGEHLAKEEVAGKVALTKAETTAKEEVPEKVPAPETAEAVEEKIEEKHRASLETAKKAAMLQKRLEALKQELEIHRELETKKPEEMKLIEEKVKLLEDKLQQYYEQHPEAMLHEIGTVEVPAQVEVKHKLLFPQLKEEEKEGKIEVVREGETAEVPEEVREAERELPLPPPPRMKKRE